jgi:hypothetical protein
MCRHSKHFFRTCRLRPSKARITPFPTGFGLLAARSS